MTDGLTPRLDTLLAAQRMQDEFYGFSADEIERMPMADYARIRERAGLDPIDPYTDAYAKYEPPGVPQQPPAAPETAPEATETAPQGIDLAHMTMEQYSQIRAQLGVGGREYGKGALDGGSTADWVQAAQRKVGRSGWQGGNVQDAARIDASKYLTRNEPVTGRTGYYR